MSEPEESAIDHLVDEALEGRAAVEAAGAPVGAPLESESESEDAKPSGPTLTFAGPEDSGLSETEIDGSEQSSAEFEKLRVERDTYLADTQRLTADFANYRKQSDKRVLDAAATQSASLIRDLIPVLDACDSALVQDPESAVGPIRSALVGELEKNGLELLAPTEGETFDPEQHEAVMHEAAPEDSEHDEQTVGEVFRSGYTWKGRVIRPAMVKVIG